MTDEVVAADWTKEPLTQVDLSQLKGERSEDEIKKLMRVIWKYRHLLSDGHLDLTKTSATKHLAVCRIVTSVEDPHIQATNRSVSPADLELGRKLIEERLREGIIEKSCAPWSSSSLLVKKDGKVRMCIDYRQLNKLTVRDAYPMPKIQDIMDCLKGSKWFTGIDLSPDSNGRREIEGSHNIQGSNGRIVQISVHADGAGECDGSLEQIY